MAYFQRNDVVVTTASDPELVKYIRADADGDLSFNRCAHCGCMMCWRGEGAYDGPEHTTGVNCRMLPESAIEGIPIKVSKGPGNRMRGNCLDRPVLNMYTPRGIKIKTVVIHTFFLFIMTNLSR